MPRPARIALAVGAALVLAVLAAEPALAHGLVGRADLPIPEWLFGFGAGVVLVVSFVSLATLWREPRLEDLPERAVAHVPAWVDVVCGAVGVVVFGVVVYAGLAGSDSPAANLAPTFVYVLFWVGLVPLSLVFGNVFGAFSPWRALARGAAWLSRTVARTEAPPSLVYPERLGRWPAALGLLGFAWVELVYSRGDDPAVLAILALAYAATQLVGMSLYGIDAWSRNADAFGVYFGLVATLAPLARRDNRIVARPPLTGAARLEPVPGTVALLCVLIGSTAFDGASEGRVWNDVAPDLQEMFGDLGLGLSGALQAAFSVGLLTSVLLVGTLYAVGVLGMQLARPRHRFGDLGRRFIHSLVPIAVAYVIAHYFSLLAYQGQATAALASDPLGRGSDLLGTADAGIDYAVISATGIWYVQVGALVVGHVAALVAAHDRAVVVYRGRAATLSQALMLVVMIGFTGLGLWLLSAANA